MRYAGIDIASETHVVAVVDADGTVASKPTPFAEDATGYQTALRVLGGPGDVLIAMEATGHHWKNLFAALAAAGHAVALLNPLRTHRFAGEDLTRTKTDAIDALSIARFAAQKQPPPAHLPDPATEELREPVRLRQRLLQDFGDRVRQLHRLVDLGFPEFTRYVHGLNTELASAIMHDYPTAAAFHGVAVKRLAALRYDGTHRVGVDLARALIDAARHSVGTLHTTIDGIGPHTAACLIAELGDTAHFPAAGALAAYVGVIPGLRQSGKRHTLRAPLSPIGNARPRAALWMPTLTAVRYNLWLRAYYQQLRARGKLPKVALAACIHKLLFAIYSVAKHRRPFVPQLTVLGTTP